MPNGNCRGDILGRHELRLRRAAANHPQRVPRLTLGRPPDTASPARVLLASHRCSAGTAQPGEMSLAHGATLLALLYETALRRWDETVREVAVRRRPAVLCAKWLRRSGKWPCGTQSIPPCPAVRASTLARAPWPHHSRVATFYTTLVPAWRGRLRSPQRQLPRGLLPTVLRRQPAKQRGER